MGNAIDLPLRESTSPRRYDVPENVSIPMPSMRQWIKAGFGFALGAWVAMVLLAVPSAIVYLRVLALMLQAMTVSLGHR